MCDPISATITAAALSAGGSAINGYERNQSQNDMVNARNAATQREMERQKVFQGQTQQMFDQSVGNFAPGAQAKSLADQQGGVAQALQRNAPADVGGISTASAPRVVGANENRVVGDVRQRQAGLGDIMAKLAGYDQNTFQNNLKLNDSAREIDRVGDFAKTSAAVNGLEQKAAYNNAYKAPSGLGDLLSFAGNIGSFYGGKGGGLPFGNIFGGSNALQVNPVGSFGLGRSPTGGL